MKETELDKISLKKLNIFLKTYQAKSPLMVELKEDLENNPQFLKYYMKWKRKEITLCEMQRLLGVKSRTTCYNWIKLIEKGS